MNEQSDTQGFENDDVEAHRIPAHLNDDTDKAGLAEDDTEGHLRSFVDGPDGDEDVEGHRIRAERVRSDIELDDDVEGHRAAMVDGPDDDDDVEGHRAVMVQPPRDADNSGNQF